MGWVKLDQGQLKERVLPEKGKCLVYFFNNNTSILLFIVNIHNVQFIYK